MNEVTEIPPVVSKRNDFHPADELVEDALALLPAQFKHPDFRKWLINYTETTIKTVAMHFGVAASRGVEQAAELLCDPEFYQTRRQRRAKMRMQMKEQKAKQDWERIERLHCPTAEQVQEQIKWSERQIEYHSAELLKHQQSLERLRALAPKNIRLIPSKSIQ